MEEVPKKKPKLTTIESKDKTQSQKQSSNVVGRTTPSAMSTFVPPRGQHPTQQSYHLKASLLEEVINEKKMALMSSPAVLGFLRNAQEKVKKKKYGDLNISSKNTVIAGEQKEVLGQHLTDMAANEVQMNSKEGSAYDFKGTENKTLISKHDSVIPHGSQTDEKMIPLQDNDSGQQTVGTSGSGHMSKSSASRKHNTRSQVALQKMLAKKGKLWSEGTSAFCSVTSNQEDRPSPEKIEPKE